MVSTARPIIILHQKKCLKVIRRIKTRQIKGEVGVLTPEGEVARVRAAGIRIFSPNISEE